ncbi:hypothetical protein [Sphingomonas adhaesiva]|uniref:hypothetical protein n=1 Tax=Sphingomonas adhaesiva TaxID=28212 RepID=UPI002FF5686E
MLDDLIVDLKARAPTREGVEWYLLNNLLELRKVVANDPSMLDLENATRVLNRFAVDSMDWGDPLFKAVTAITKQAERADPN